MLNLIKTIVIASAIGLIVGLAGETVGNALAWIIQAAG
jgi:hypothetical protein